MAPNRTSRSLSSLKEHAELRPASCEGQNQNRYPREIGQKVPDHLRWSPPLQRIHTPRQGFHIGSRFPDLVLGRFGQYLYASETIQN